MSRGKRGRRPKEEIETLEDQYKNALTLDEY